MHYNVTGQKTGREIFPGFVARSQQDPTSVLADSDVWAAAWFATRDRLATQREVAFNPRWKRFSKRKMCVKK